MTRAVILAAGRGSRLSAASSGVVLTPEQATIADGGLKPLMPLGSCRLIDHSLATLAQIGVREVVVVLGPHSMALREHLTRSDASWSRWLVIEFALQATPRGTADALLAAEPLVGDAPFLLINGDNLYAVAALSELLAARGPALLALDRARVLADGESNLTSEKIARFARIERDASGFLSGIVEKPEPEIYTELVARSFATGEPYLAAVNAFRFEPEIFSACRGAQPSPRGELELPSAVLDLVASGTKFRVIVSSEPFLDLTERADVPDLCARLAGKGHDL